MAYIKTSGLSPVFILFATANFIVVPIFSLFPLLILSHHQGTVMNYSLVEILFQVGIIGGAMALMISKKKASMKSVVISGILLSFVLLALSFVPVGSWWLFYAICIILGVNLAFIDTQLMSVLQLSIPKDLQGRGFATMFPIIKSINPLGLIMWGIIGEFIPVVTIFLLSPVISLVVYFLLAKFTDMVSFGEKYDQRTNTEPSRDDEQIQIKELISPATEPPAQVVRAFPSELES